MVRVRVPASTSNLGSGFDAVGAALQLYLTVEMEAADNLQISTAGLAGGGLPKDAENLVYRAAQKFFAHINHRAQALRMHIDNPIPLCRGLGGSGAAVVAGLLGAAHLAGIDPDPRSLLTLAHDLEGHPENAAASLLGGLTLNCIEGQEIVCKRMGVDDRLRAVLLIPETIVTTADARRVLPKSVPHTDAVFNLQRSALLAHAFSTGDYSALRTAMQDRLHQPYRKRLIPFYDIFETAGYDMGALGVCISGSGSTVLALATEATEPLAERWRREVQNRNLQADVRILSFDNQGAHVTSRKPGSA